MANTCAAMSYAWLYVAGGNDALARLAHALSIPVQHVFSGDEALAAQRIPYFELSAIYYFAVQGDADWSCEVQLRELSIATARNALQELSRSGLTIAMMDNTNSSPFVCTVFERGEGTSATLVCDDETDRVTLYRAAGAA